MSSIPQCSYAVRQIHTNIDKHQSWVMAINKTAGYEGPNVHRMFQVNQLDLDRPLTRYNSALMKSIWGMYNRYSVHNLKSFTEGENSRVTGGQPLLAAAPPASSGYGPKGGSKKNGSLPSPIWEALCIGQIS